MDDHSADSGRSGIGVLDKSVLVLLALKSGPLSLAELARHTDLPRATAHRLAQALQAHRLLARDAVGRFLLGPGLRELAAHAADPLAGAAAHVLPALREHVGESLQLYRREGGVRVCVAAAEPSSGLRDWVPVGARLPLTAGSGAQVLLAWEPVDVRERLLRGSAFDERTLAQVRERGWAHSVGQREVAVASVSAPVWSADGTVAAALCVSGPAERIGARDPSWWAQQLSSAQLTLAADA